MKTFFISLGIVLLVMAAIFVGTDLLHSNVNGFWSPKRGIELLRELPRPTRGTELAHWLASNDQTDWPAVKNALRVLFRLPAFGITAFLGMLFFAVGATRR